MHSRPLSDVGFFFATTSTQTRKKKTALSLSLLATSPHYIPTPAHATHIFGEEKVLFSHHWFWGPLHIDFQVGYRLSFYLSIGYQPRPDGSDHSLVKNLHLI